MIPQSRQVAAARGGEKGVGHPLALLAVDGIARPVGPHVLARPRRELADGGGVPVQGRGDLVEAEAEHVVQQEGRAFEGREPLQRQHQRHGEILAHLVRALRFQNRLGQPGSDIGLALDPRRFEDVEAQARDGLGQEGARFANGGAVRLVPADIGLLHHILGFRDGAEHAVGEADQPRPEGLEPVRGVAVRQRHGSPRPDGWNGSRWRSGSRC